MSMEQSLKNIKQYQKVTLAESIEMAFDTWSKSERQINFFEYYVNEIERDGGVICNKCNVIHHSSDKVCE